MFINVFENIMSKSLIVTLVINIADLTHFVELNAIICALQQSKWDQNQIQISLIKYEFVFLVGKC